MLGLHPLPASHTGIVIRHAYMELLSKWDIEEHNVLHVVSDNGTNMIYALKDLATIVQLTNAINDDDEICDEEVVNNDECDEFDEPNIFVVTKRLTCTSHRLESDLNSAT